MSRMNTMAKVRSLKKDSMKKVNKLKNEPKKSMITDSIRFLFDRESFGDLGDDAEELMSRARFAEGQGNQKGFDAFVDELRGLFDGVKGKPGSAEKVEKGEDLSEEIENELLMEHDTEKVVEKKAEAKEEDEKEDDDSSSDEDGDDEDEDDHSMKENFSVKERAALLKRIDELEYQNMELSGSLAECEDKLRKKSKECADFKNSNAVLKELTGKSSAEMKKAKNELEKVKSELDKERISSKSMQVEYEANCEVLRKKCQELEKQIKDSWDEKTKSDEACAMPEVEQNEDEGVTILDTGKIKIIPGESRIVMFDKEMKKITVSEMSFFLRWMHDFETKTENGEDTTSAGCNAVRGIYDIAKIVRE